MLNYLEKLLYNLSATFMRRFHIGNEKIICDKITENINKYGIITP